MLTSSQAFAAAGYLAVLRACPFTFGLGMSPLGPRMRPSLTRCGIMSGVARHAVKSMDLPLLSRMEAASWVDPTTSAPAGTDSAHSQACRKRTPTAVCGRDCLLPATSKPAIAMLWTSGDTGRLRWLGTRVCKKLQLVLAYLLPAPHQLLLPQQTLQCAALSASCEAALLLLVPSGHHAWGLPSDASAPLLCGSRPQFSVQPARGQKRTRVSITSGVFLLHAAGLPFVTDHTVDLADMAEHACGFGAVPATRRRCQTRALAHRQVAAQTAG